MFNQLRTTLSQSPRVFIEDALGVVGLFALLIAGLHLPIFA